jgi:hypothetical protein
MHFIIEKHGRSNMVLQENTGAKIIQSTCTANVPVRTEAAPVTRQQVLPTGAEQGLVELHVHASHKQAFTTSPKESRLGEEERG